MACRLECPPVVGVRREFGLRELPGVLHPLHARQGFYTQTKVTMVSSRFLSYGVVVVILCFSAVFFAYDLGNAGILPRGRSGVSGVVFSATKKFPPVYATGRYPKFTAVQTESCHIPVVAVTTTTRGASPCVDQVAGLMPVIVVGDAKSPPIFKSNKSNVSFLSVEKQHKLFPEFSKQLPLNHFSRKNIGYLFALQMGACHIWDFDDDNYLTSRTIGLLEKLAKTNLLPDAVTQLTCGDSVVNPYLLYGAPSFIWPRGYPLELLSNRTFPRLTPVTARLKTDVVQVMQSADPDVDADWRLEYGNHLPMAWASSDAVSQMMIAIDPSKYTPFNAQSTLMTRRAAMVAMLPHTVHGRVSDIWRSYIMQYFIKRFEPGPGIVAFSGMFVDHLRNKHSYMADRQAEVQLIEQVAALVSYLEHRPCTSSWLAEELVILYDDLYQRGFICKEDVYAAVAWVTALTAHMPNIRLMQYSIPKTEEQIPRANVMGVVHINHGYRANVPVWMALHGHQFRTVSFYTPGTSVEQSASISGINVIRLSHDGAGFLAYESMVDAIERIADIRYKKGRHYNITYADTIDVDGALFLHDDVAFHAEISTNVSWLPHNNEHHGPLLPSSRWYWGNSTWGLPAFQNAKNRVNSKLLKSMVPYRGYADVYFVHKSHMLTFASLGRTLLDSQVFLEVAVPTIFHGAFAPDTFQEGRLLSHYARHRSNATRMVSDYCSQGYDFVHPVKLSTVDGIVGHLHALTC
jgi:hypothetical protein